MKKAILAVRTIGDPCLREVSKRLEQVGPGERILIQAMLETMYEAKGVGLAAPQVGINKQIMVVDVGDGPLALINPEIIEAQGVCEMEEGCLSVPNAAVNITRAETIRVNFLDENGDPQEKECSGLLARVIQHENDHLQGKLIVDYADEKEKEEIKKMFPDIKM